LVSHSVIKLKSGNEARLTISFFWSP